MKNTWWFAFGTTVFAIAGVLVGMRFVLFGSISRSGDAMYQITLFIALLITLVVQIAALRQPAASVEETSAAESAG